MLDTLEKYHLLTAAETLTRLESSTTGLTSVEAQRRLSQFGPNKLPQAKHAGWVVVLFGQFKSPLIYVLLAAALISLALNEVIDASVIFMAVVIQVLVGFIQEFKAQASLSALQQVIALSARVRRE